MSYKFYQNRTCEYFPCHNGLDEQDFSCLFCYCPLYALGRRCGGNFQYTETGVKDCSECTFPHDGANYNKLLARFDDILKVMQLSDAQPETVCNRDQLR